MLPASVMKRHRCVCWDLFFLFAEFLNMNEWFGIGLDKTMRYLRLFAYGWIVQIESVQIQVGGSVR